MTDPQTASRASAAPTSGEPTSPEAPWPVRTVARKIAEWINRLGTIWVEGQVTQISARPGTATAFITLRDPSADVSLSITCSTNLLRGGQQVLAEGSQVVVHGKPTFYVNRGTLSLRVDEIRAVGIGELLARIERLRRLLAAEGLFEQGRKRRLPFLPGTIGLITGRASAAEHDVLTNAERRWPSVRFRVSNVAVQGPTAVPQILSALSELDADPAVEVIVLARGGGSVEDLLPFSDEALCRAVSACRTPVVSAIGHEPDTPLVDHVADLRASTPTDAAKRIVPDIAEELHRIQLLRERARRCLHGWVDRERRLLDQLRSRPVLADPLGPITRRAEDIATLRERARRAMLARLTAEHTGLTATRSRLTTLGPAATLARGYAILQVLDDAVDIQDDGDTESVDGQGVDARRAAEPDSSAMSDGDAAERATPAGRGRGPHVVRSIRELGPGSKLRLRVVDGVGFATVSAIQGPAADGSSTAGDGGS